MKWPDLMIVNEVNCKCVCNVDIGSVSQTIEAEVGGDQPRQSL